MNQPLGFARARLNNPIIKSHFTVYLLMFIMISLFHTLSAPSRYSWQFSRLHSVKASENLSICHQLASPQATHSREQVTPQSQPATNDPTHALWLLEPLTAFLNDFSDCFWCEPCGRHFAVLQHPAKQRPA